MDLIAVDIDGTLASNRDQMDKYLTGFFARPGNDGSNSPAWKDSVIESLIADGNRIIHAFEDTDHEVYLRRGIPVTWVAPIRDYIGEWHYESIDIDPVAWAA